MIVVFVSDQDGVDAVSGFAGALEAFEGLAPAEAGVDEDANAIGGNPGRVAGAAAGE